MVGSLALAVPAIADASVPSGFGASTVAAGLVQPTAIAFRPDGGMLVTEKGGALRLVRGSETVTLTSLPVCTDKSMGLLGVAVDPGFSLNGFIYLYRTRPVGNEGPGCPTEPGRVNEIVRLRLEGDRVAEGPVPIFTGIRTDNGQHNGGTLRIGLDGKLYVSTGDTGVGDFLPGGFTPPGGSTNPFAQILGELPGKVLRIGLDGGIPADNPFVGVAGAREEVFAYGFRNPFRFGVDPVTGWLWLGDVGQNTWRSSTSCARAATTAGRAARAPSLRAAIRRATCRRRSSTSRTWPVRWALRSRAARSRPAVSATSAGSTSSATTPPTAFIAPCRMPRGTG